MRSMTSILKYGLPQQINTFGKQVFRSLSNIGEITETKIKVADHEINYVKAGSGPYPVLCMPGALGTAWSDFKPQIEGLNKDLFTVVAWDPPGYGKSIPPARQFPVDFYENDAELALLLMKELSFPKFSILGWSDGGISGIIMAAKYPQSVDKLIFWGANSFIYPSELKIYEDIRDINKWSDKMRAPMIQIYGQEYFKKTWEDWVDGVKNVFNENNGDICMGIVRDISCPTLILHGEKDPMIHKDHVPFLHSNIENSTLHVYPEGKHNIHLKYAEDFNKRVSDFLSS